MVGSDDLEQHLPLGLVPKDGLDPFKARHGIRAVTLRDVSLGLQQQPPRFDVDLPQLAQDDVVLRVLDVTGAPLDLARLPARRGEQTAARRMAHSARRESAHLDTYVPLLVTEIDVQLDDLVILL